MDSNHRFADFRTTTTFVAHFWFVVWTFSSSWHFCFRWSPLSLYTFSFLSLARDCHFKGFPEFDDFYFEDFSSSTQFTLKSVDSSAGLHAHLNYLQRTITYYSFILPHLTYLSNKFFRKMVARVRFELTLDTFWECCLLPLGYLAIIKMWSWWDWNTHN